MQENDLNPHFFAYGQFPLFLTFFTTPNHNLPTITITLRFWSAFFSSLSVLFFYFIIKQFFNSKKIIFVSTLFFIFTPGLIQSAHFGTTESVLILVFLVNIYLSQKIFNHLKPIYLIFSALVSGIGLATKISSLILISPILLSLFFSFIKNKNFLKFLISTFIFLILTVFVGFMFSPYNILDFSNFRSSIVYEINVANGETPVFYTRQFLRSIPYIFQFQRIFPYTNGIPILILSIISFFIVLKSFLKQKFDFKLLLVFIPSLIFFLYQGQLFVKWTRFMSPIFFIFPFLTAFLFSKLKNKLLFNFLALLCVLPGLLFFQKYFSLDIRVLASNWIIKNIAANTKIISESGNVVNLPLQTSNLNITNFDFYQLDQDPESQSQLSTLVEESDYIIVPSRRVFKNQNNSTFPKSQNYYQRLFSGELGFHQIKQFSLNNNFFLNSENAEETWSVFDNPTIRIYQKT